MLSAGLVPLSCARSKCLNCPRFFIGSNGHALASYVFVPRGRGLLTVLAERKQFEKPELETADTENGALARLHGRIDIDSSPAVRERLLAVLQSRDLRTLNIDLSAVTHMDSSGVATLIEALKIARGRKTHLKLQGLHDRLHRLFDATGLLSLFNGSDRV